MIVVDTSVFVASTCAPDPDGHQAREALGADRQWLVPEHFRVEAANAIRGMSLRRKLEVATATEAIDALALLEIMIIPASTLLPRMWQLRDTVTAYDAAYVALAELFDLDLLTADRRLARAPGIRCRIVHP